MSQWLQSRSSCVYTLFILLVIRITQIYERHMRAPCGEARVFRETINQRRSVSEGAAAVSVRCERDRGTYTSAPIHRTKQNKNDRFPFHFVHNIGVYICVCICTIRSRAGRPIKPMQTCLQRIFKEGFIHIIFPKRDIHKTLHTPWKCGSVCVCVCVSAFTYTWCTGRRDGERRRRRDIEGHGQSELGSRRLHSKQYTHTHAHTFIYEHV